MKIEKLQQIDELHAYLQSTSIVDFKCEAIKKQAESLFADVQDEVEKARLAFEFVRDEISHTWDIQGDHVTCGAAEVLEKGEGFCYAKSHLLAALLRHEGIPTGFCYQKLVLFEKPEDGYSIHALNAIWLESLGKWIRVDARGNKPGVEAEFSLHEERLAFPVNTELGEYDDSRIFSEPHPVVVKALESSADAIELYKYHLPEDL